MPATPTRGRVLVIGAGLAGLTAAYELALRGFEVEVLEARDRPGGRILTDRDAASPRVASELGAIRIPTCHDLPLRYVEAFGLRLAPFFPRLGLYTNLVQGQRVRLPDRHLPDPATLGVALTPAERAMWRGEQRSYFADAMAELGDVFDPQWPADAATWALDGLSEHDYWKGAGASDAWIQSHDFANHDTAFQLRISALFALHAKALLAKAPAGFRFVRIVGGMDQLPRAFARRLQGRVRHGAVVASIEQDATGVRVEVEGESGRYEADRAVVAVPLGCLARIAVSPALPADHAQAIHAIPSGSACKVALTTRRAFWRDRGANGFVMADAPATIVPSAPVLGSRRRSLCVYFKTSAWPRLRALTTEQRIGEAADLVERAFPGAARFLEGGVVQAWAEDPWARGSYAIPGPGQMRALREVLPRSEGRLHFAGDHTSPWTFWMQGAIHSGLRVVDEIMEREPEAAR